MTVFFTADTHFGDTRILNTAKRPFKTIAAHDQALIERWQSVVGQDDEIWPLGDVCAPSLQLEIGGVGPPLTIVRGNCDANYDWPLVVDLKRNGVRLN